MGQGLAMAKRIDEVVKRKLAIKAANESNPGIMIEDREIIMLTANEMAGTQGSVMMDDEDSQDDDMANFESLKAKFDAYGVAVRAGAITPATEDEVQFRKEAGLPAMSPAARGAWKEDKGFRRPITLVSGSAPPPQGAGSPRQPIQEDEDSTD